MALDWSKEISFSGLRKRAPRAKKADYPSKTYMNLIVQEKREIDVRRAIPAVILTILVVALISKFGIFDFYDRLAQKQLEFSQQTSMLNDLQAQLADYDEVKAEYEMYESSKLAADDLTVSALDALKLIDRYVAPRADIDSIDLQGNVVSLNLSNITLDGVGQLVSTLYEQPSVRNVSVSTAATDQNDNNDKTAAMIITLQKPQTEEAKQLQDQAAQSS